MRDVARAGDLAEQPNTLLTRLDVQHRASIEEAVERAIGRFGRINVLVNNAGFGSGSSSMSTCSA